MVCRNRGVKPLLQFVFGAWSAGSVKMERQGLPIQQCGRGACGSGRPLVGARSCRALPARTQPFDRLGALSLSNGRVDELPLAHARSHSGNQENAGELASRGFTAMSRSKLRRTLSGKSVILSAAKDPAERGRRAASRWILHCVQDDKPEQSISGGSSTRWRSRLRADPESKSPRPLA